VARGKNLKIPQRGNQKLQKQRFALDLSPDINVACLAVKQQIPILSIL
jgi:hypothetical protein